MQFVGSGFDIARRTEIEGLFLELSGGAFGYAFGTEVFAASGAIPQGRLGWMSVAGGRHNASLAIQCGVNR